MLSDDEALAVLLGLVAGRRVGLLTAADAASETAAAKIRRVLPERLGRRLDALLGFLAFTAARGETRGEAAVDPAQHVLSGLAAAPYKHEVTLRIQATVEQIRARLPASVAIIEELPAADGAGSGTDPWFRVELRAQRLDWVPPVLASLDRPFLVERPDELRDLIAALADRLAAAARRKPPDSAAPPGDS